MKTLLVLTPRLPYPPVGGDRLRIYNLCKHLASEFELTLLSLCESREEMDLAVPEDGVFSRIERVFHSKTRRVTGCLAALPTKKPLQVGYYQNAEFARRLSVLTPLHDGILAHLIRTGAYLTGCKLPKILEMTDAISLTYSRRGKMWRGSPFRALAYRLEGRRLIRFEREMIEKTDLTILVSPVDHEFLAPGTKGGKVLICSNGVDTEILPFQYAPDGKTIVFIGNNTALHNADAVLHFAAEIFPKIRSRCPGAQLKVIGLLRDRLRETLEGKPGVTVTGGVGNIAEAAMHATCGICPIRWGAGVQNKLLEYMSLGIPAVTSPIGLEGLEAQPGVHLFVAQSCQEWVDRICELVENPASGKAVAVAARKFVETHHAWAALMDPVHSSIRELIRQT